MGGNIMFNVILYTFISIIMSTLTFAGDELPECLEDCSADQIETLQEFAENADNVTEEDVEDFCEWWLEQDDNGCATDCDEEVLDDLDSVTNACFEVLTPECMQDCAQIDLEVLYDFMTDDPSDSEVEEFCTWWDTLDGTCVEDCDAEITSGLDKISEACSDLLGVDLFANRFLIDTIYPNLITHTKLGIRLF